MSELRTNQLKQLNYLDKAINNLNKALKIGEKQEELGYSNGRIASKVRELLNIYNDQFDVQDHEEYDGPGSN
jgi:hypothetical protein